MYEGKTIWWIDIEGIRLRYGTASPSWNPSDSGTNRAIKDWLTDLPDIDRQNVEPLDGKTSLSGFSVSILDVDDALCDLFSSYESGGRTYLTSEVGASDTSIDVQDASVFDLPCDLYIDRETMRGLSAEGNNIAVTRGMYGSKAEAHSLTDSNGYTRSVVVADHPIYWLGRPCKLCWCNENDNESDANIIRGKIRDLEEDQGAWKIRASGYIGDIARKIGEGVPTTILISKLWGGGIPGQYGRLLDEDPVVTNCTSVCLIVSDDSNFPSSGFVSVGGTEIIKYYKHSSVAKIFMLDSSFESFLGYPSIYPYRFAPTTINRAYFRYDTMASPLFINEHYQVNEDEKFFLQHERLEEVKLVLTHHDFSKGDFDKLLPPVAILQILCSTGKGTNGTWDTLPEQFGLGIDYDLIDEDSFLAEADLLADVADCRFYIGEPVEAKEWIEKHLLRPWLLYLVEDSQGRISIRHVRTKIEASDDSSKVSITHDDILELPEYLPGEQAPISSIKWKLNRCPNGNEYLGEINIIMGDTREIYRGSARKIGDLEVASIYDRRVTNGKIEIQAGIGSGIATMLDWYGARLWDRFANVPTPKIKLVLPANAYPSIRPGVIISVTSSLIPDWLSGTRGVTQELFEVQEAQLNPRNSSLSVTAWYIGGKNGALGGYRKIAPSAKVQSSSNDKITCYSGVFARSSSEASFFKAGDKVICMNANYVPLAGATPEVLTISSVSGDMITLTNTPSYPPEEGDYVETVYYDQESSNQKSNWASLADANGTLGSSNDPAHVRS